MKIDLKKLNSALSEMREILSEETELTLSKDILQKLGRKGRELAKKHFNANYRNQMGKEFNQLVALACNKAFSDLKMHEFVVPAEISNNVANAVAAQIDR